MIEYNLVQKLFLHSENKAKLLRHITTNFDNYKKLFKDAYDSILYRRFFNGYFDVSDSVYNAMIKELEFEAEYGWSIRMKIDPIHSRVHILPSRNPTEAFEFLDQAINIYGIDLVKYNHSDTTVSLVMPNVEYNTQIFCSIVPTISENYPEVLRMMKEQMRQTKTKYGPSHFYLLVCDFNASSVNSDEILSIFEGAGFSVVMIKDLFVLDKKGLTQKEIEYYKIVEKVQELEVHNAMLLEKMKSS
ncbi:hypothetical protein [Flavobacterium sp.]|jgi:hypothetical protein|uniref:hypothetical protein n=1 Tax=Flavobacterium sp. TaxID=239 RepID=UPI0037BF3687